MSWSPPTATLRSCSACRPRPRRDSHVLARRRAFLRPRRGRGRPLACPLSLSRGAAEAPGSRAARRAVARSAMRSTLEAGGAAPYPQRAQEGPSGAISPSLPGAVAARGTIATALPECPQYPRCSGPCQAGLRAHAKSSHRGWVPGDRTWPPSLLPTDPRHFYCVLRRSR